MGNEPRLGSKVFYKIGEVSKISKLPAYVLRFWESEFSFLKPKKSRGNQRLYVQRDRGKNWRSASEAICRRSSGCSILIRPEPFR